MEAIGIYVEPETGHGIMKKSYMLRSWRGEDTRKWRTIGHVTKIREDYE
jgi:hypothetical protein